LKRGALCGKLNVKLWYNEQGGDWSVEINDKRYQSVNFEFVKELMKRALIDAEEFLAKAPNRRTQ
jgi:hypothetical protein